MPEKMEDNLISSDKWNLLQQLILILSLFEEKTQYLSSEKYAIHSIMHSMINKIKRLLLTSNSHPSTSPTSPTPILLTSLTSFRLPFLLSSLTNILLEIENA